MEANKNFELMDGLIEYFNKHYEDVNLQYSTPETFIKAVHAQNITWASKTTDMFPYADKPGAYWTGYYSSRPNAKSQNRLAHAHLHASNRLFAENVIDQRTSEWSVSGILAAKERMFDAMGVFQHHDAVTGTSKQHVADWYAEDLANAIAKSSPAYGRIIAELTEKVTGSQASEWSQCHVNNSTFEACPVDDDTEGTFLLTTHNPSTVRQQV